MLSLPSEPSAVKDMSMFSVSRFDCKIKAAAQAAAEKVSGVSIGSAVPASSFFAGKNFTV